MKPEEVPPALVEKARKVLMEHGPSQGAEPRPLDSDDPCTAEWIEGWREAWLAMPEVLAAVLPEIQAQAWQEGYITRAFTPRGPGGIPIQEPTNPYRLTTTTEEPTT